MILRPDFYVPDNSDPLALRAELSLQPTLPTAIVLFGGHGSKVMFDITERLDAAGLPVQLILICGRNEALAAKLRARKWCMPVNVIGFTKEIHKWMRAADFLIGKPGPGSIAEAMVRKLPVLIECNSWTLPQERYQRRMGAREACRHRSEEFQRGSRRRKPNAGAHHVSPSSAIM